MEGRLPIMDEVAAEARRRGIELVVRPTLEAVQLLQQGSHVATSLDNARSEQDDLPALREVGFRANRGSSLPKALSTTGSTFIMCCPAPAPVTAAVTPRPTPTVRKATCSKKFHPYRPQRRSVMLEKVSRRPSAWQPAPRGVRFLVSWARARWRWPAC
jgi:hypothetical protein